MKRELSPSKPSPIVFCCLAILLGYFGVNVIQTVAEGQTHQDRVAMLEQQIESLRAKKQSLQQELELVKSPHFIEGEARNKLNMAKESEVVVIFPQQPNVLSATRSTPSKTPTTPSHSIGHLGEWYKLLFN